MKNLLFTLAACLYAVAGTSQIVHQDITDASVTIEQPSGNELVAIDFDSDGTEEYNFRWDVFNGGIWFLHVTFAENNEINLTGEENFAQAPYITPMSFGDPIDGDALWGADFPEPLIGDDEDVNFRGLGDKYVGVKFNLDGNVHYGWILVSFDDNNLFTVKEYAYQSTPNTPLNAGDTGETAGVEEMANNLIQTYPNPAENIITVQNSQDFSISSITINDLSGKKVSEITMNKSFSSESIDVSSLKAGVYIMNFHNGDRKLSSTKLIKL